MFLDRLSFPLPGNTSVGEQARQPPEPDRKRQGLFVSNRRGLHMQHRSGQYDRGPQQRHQEYIPHRTFAAYY